MPGTLAFDRLTEVTAPESSRAEMPNALLVLAHPDDEVIAIGGRMGRFANSHFVHGTPLHEPLVLYDGYPWGMDSTRFCELAREAELELRDRNRDVTPKR